ncbi:MAG: hypothetical protein V1738_04795 [Patescibacteria group bacterium]
MKRTIYIVVVFTALAVVSGVAVGLSVNRQPTLVSVSSILSPRNIDDMTRDSYAVILGVVEDVSIGKEKSFYRPGEMDVVTTATINVEQYLNNPHNLDLKTVEVKTLGGTVGNLTLDAESHAKFAMGTTMVIFLDRHDDGSFHVYGVAQGAYTINEDGTIGTEKEKPFLDSVMTAGGGTLKGLSLNQLRSQIQNSIK